MKIINVLYVKNIKIYSSNNYDFHFYFFFLQFGVISKWVTRNYKEFIYYD